MKLSLLHEGETSRPMKKVWQDEERQGKRYNRWYTPKAASSKDPGTYRWGTGKPMSGDSYNEHILPVGK